MASPRPKLSDVDVETHGADARLLRIKGTTAGKVVAAVARQRRAPVTAWRSARWAREDGPPPAPDLREPVRAVYLTLCGPGTLGELDELVESITAYDPEGTRIVAVQDATADVRWPAVAARHPRVDVLRCRWPTGGPPRQSPALALGLRAVQARYAPSVVVKLDTDALVTGPGLTARAQERFATDPGLGLLGTSGLRADGVPEEHGYDAWVLGSEVRASRAVRDAVARAHAGAYDGAKVHGGIYVMAGAALARLAETRGLQRLPPWWTQISEDLWITLQVTALGLRVGSWGGPGEPTASASKWLPVPLHEISARGVLAVHSVRRGADGEPEAEVRRVLREGRRVHLARRSGAPS